MFFFVIHFFTLILSFSSNKIILDLKQFSFFFFIYIICFGLFFFLLSISLAFSFKTENFFKSYYQHYYYANFRALFKLKKNYLLFYFFVLNNISHSSRINPQKNVEFFESSTLQFIVNLHPFLVDMQIRSARYFKLFK